VLGALDSLAPIPSIEIDLRLDALRYPLAQDIGVECIKLVTTLAVFPNEPLMTGVAALGLGSKMRHNGRGIALPNGRAHNIMRVPFV
jgi:hypothetical protein